MTRATPATLLALLAGLIVYALADAYGRGHADGLADGAARSVAAHVRVIRQVDSVYVRDTIRLARWRDRWDSVRVTDTVVRDSVVYVNRDIADSTISACRAVVVSCEARVAARDSALAALRAALKAEQAARPSQLRVAIDRALWGAAGLGVGVLVGR